MGAVFNRDQLYLKFAANRGFNPLPHIIDLSLNLIWKGVVSKEVEDRGSKIRSQKIRDDDRYLKYRFCFQSSVLCHLASET